MTRLGAALRRVDLRLPGVDLPLMSVSQTRGVIRRSELTDTPARAETLDVYKVIRRGEIAFNKMSIRAGALGTAPEDGLVTYHYEVMHARPGNSAQFLVYLMKSDWFIAELVRRERGIGAGNQANVRTTEVPFRVLRTIDAWLPSHRTQLAIANFLDQETAKIDALIEKQNALIDRLRERRDAEWSALYEAMLASQAPIRRVLTSIVDGPFGSSLTSAHYVDEGTRVVRLGNIGINEFRDVDRAFISGEYALELSAHALEPGDVVMAGLGDERMPLGRAAVVPAELGPAIVKADCYRLRPNHRVSPDYLAWALSAPPVRRQITDLARGATRSRLNTALARMVRVKLPSPSTQDAVVAGWRDSMARYDSLIAKAERFVELARERRSALITAAVTGQIDVSGEAAA